MTVEHGTPHEHEHPRVSFGLPVVDPELQLGDDVHVHLAWLGGDTWSVAAHAHDGYEAHRYLVHGEAQARALALRTAVHWR